MFRTNDNYKSKIKISNFIEWFSLTAIKLKSVGFQINNII